MRDCNWTGDSEATRARLVTALRLLPYPSGLSSATEAEAPDVHARRCGKPTGEPHSIYSLIDSDKPGTENDCYDVHLQTPRLFASSDVVVRTPAARRKCVSCRAGVVDRFEVVMV
jgi:hypothetical protein